MKIRTLWKQWDDDALEVLCAMDENTCDLASEAWREQVEAACKRYSIVEGMDTREVLIEVPSEPILAAFADPVVQATAVEAASEGEPVADYEYRLSWECPSAACVMAHQDVIWESLTADEWDALPWERSYRIADGGDLFTQRQTLEGWAEDHYEPVRNVRFERQVRLDPDEGWSDIAVRGATGVTHWKATSEGER